MSKLLRANFSRLFKSTLYRICMLVTAGMGITFTLSRYFDIQKRPEYYANMPDEFKCVEGFIFSVALHIIFFAAIFIGSYLGTEYSDGTIRNKILAGHKRFKIYLANLITCSAASMFLMLIEMFSMYVVGKMVFTVSLKLGAGKIIFYILFECIAMMAFTSILVFFMILIQNKAAGSVVVLIMTILMFMAAFWSKDTLDEPQYVSEYVMTEADEAGNDPAITLETWENPRYVSGVERDIYGFIYDVLPTCQLLRIAFNLDETIPVMMVYSILICCIVTGLGMAKFNKMDLK